MGLNFCLEIGYKWCVPVMEMLKLWSINLLGGWMLFVATIVFKKNDGSLGTCCMNLLIVFSRCHFNSLSILMIFYRVVLHYLWLLIRFLFLFMFFCFPWGLEGRGGIFFMLIGCFCFISFLNHLSIFYPIVILGNG